MRFRECPLRLRARALQRVRQLRAPDLPARHLRHGDPPCYVVACWLIPGLEHAAGGDLGQERVGLRLLVERLVHQVLDPVEAAVVGKLPRGAVRRDLVVLDPLGGGDQRGVARHRFAAHLDHLLALGDEALHSLADLGRVGDSELAERLLDAVQVPARLLEMLLEGLAKLVVMRRLRHLRERRHQLRLGAVQILELLLQDVLQRIEPHVLFSFSIRISRWGSAPVELQTGVPGVRWRRGRRDAVDQGQPHRRRGRDPDHRRHDPRHRPPPARADVVRPGLPQHRLDPQRDHVHRRRRRHPPLPRLPDRAARRARELPRDGVAPVRGRAADARRARRRGRTRFASTRTCTRT